MTTLSVEQQAKVALFQRHVEAELAGDLAATMATMTDDPHLNHVPTMAGGVGRQGVQAFYRDHLVGKLAVAVIVGFSDGKIAYEHIYWDQASVLVQVGLLNPTGLPVGGADIARKLVNPKLPSRPSVLAEVSAAAA
jgi:carboxymethylenebutenolidase